MDIIGAIISLIRIILGIILVFFVPGFAFSWIFYPLKDSIPAITRLAYSLVLSIASVILGVLFLDIVLGIDTTPINIVIIIVLMTGLALLFWQIELKYLKSGLQQVIRRKLEEEAFITLNLASIEQSLNTDSIRQKMRGLFQRLFKKREKKQTEL